MSIMSTRSISTERGVRGSTPTLMVTAIATGMATIIITTITMRRAISSSPSC